MAREPNMAVEHADMPRPLDGHVDRGEAVYGDDHRRFASIASPVELRLDPPVIGFKNLPHPRIPLSLRNPDVTRNSSPLADLDDRCWRPQGPIAVDDEARIGLADDDSAKRLAKKMGDRTGAEVRCDMTAEVRLA